MGMYTEIVAGFELRHDTPPLVIECLRAMVDSRASCPTELPTHPVFACERWRAIGSCSSYSFGFHRQMSSIIFDEHEGKYAVAFRASLKDYDGEIEKFFDWIRPYVAKGSGDRDMLGYSIYENASEPTLYFADLQDDA